MKISDDLFHLIKSLDQSEKRYFKIFANMHIKSGDKNKYVHLFDAIDKQNVADGYNEYLIRKKFKNESFIKQLHVVKNYLYHSILKSLRLYHSEKDKISELQDILKDVGILFNKSLYKQCKKQLEKAKQIALKFERHLELLQITDWEKTLARVNAYSNVSEEELKKIYDDQSEILEQIENIKEYWLLSIKSFLIRKKTGAIRDKKDLKKFNEIINHPLLKSEEKATTFMSKTFYNNIKGLYYHTNNDLKNLLKYCNRLVKLQEDNPVLMKQENYIAALNNLLLVQIELKEYDEAIKTIHKLRSLETSSVSMQTRIFVTSYDTELNLYLKSGNFEKGIPLVKEIQIGLNEFKEKINKESEVLFYYNIAYLYFGVKDYDSSLKWINRIINDKTLNLREDIQCYSRILNLFIHYELKNFSLIEYSVKSTQRYLTSKHSLHKFEASVLSYFRKLISVKNKSEEKNICLEWEYELKNISRDSFESKALEYFDFHSWLESKLNGKDFVKVLKEKAEK